MQAAKKPSRWNNEWHSSHPLPARATEEFRFAWHIAHRAHCECCPMPHADAAVLGTFESPPLRTLLADPHEFAAVAARQVLALLERQPGRAAELIALSLDADELVARRSRALLAQCGGTVPVTHHVAGG